MSQDAVVIAVEVASGAGLLANEPITTATLRDPDGGEHVVRIVGGTTKSGGTAHLAGHVVPVLGARVRIDLRLRPLREDAALSLAWMPNAPAGTWTESAFPIRFVLGLPVSRDLGNDTLAEVDVAARTWGRPTCTAFRARAEEARPLTSGEDGINAVFFHDATWPAELLPGALGQTIVHVNANGELQDTDIHLNGVDFRFSKDGAAGTQDARGVLVHEIGHALGLGHATDSRATMYVSGTGLRWRSLERDDVDGICALYPGAGSAGCDAEPCPTGFSCVAGACQRPGERADVCSPCAPDVGACEGAGDDARCIEVGRLGRVCGRGCIADRECGAGFACRPTTSAGDWQCLSLSDCKNGANTCRTDADCTRPNRCRAGACMGSAAEGTADAGAADGGVDTGAARTSARGGDCDCDAPGRSSRPPLLALVLVAAVSWRRRLTRDR